MRVACLLCLVASQLVQLNLGGTQAEQIVLISVDGVHNADLEWAVRYIPSGNIAMMRKNSVIFRNARQDLGGTAGLMSMLSGSSPKHSGVYGSSVYCRNLWPAGTPCKEGEVPTGRPGTVYDLSKIGAVANGSARITLDESKLPLNSTCGRVWPHSFPIANSIFEVMKGQGMISAWADTDPAVEMLLGPKQDAITHLYVPSVSPIPTSGDGREALRVAQQHDRLMIDAMINWMLGATATGEGPADSTPNFMGCTLRSLSTAQRFSLGGGYKWDGATPDGIVQEALVFIDAQVGRIMGALRASELLESSTVIITGKHGHVHNLGFEDLEKPCKSNITKILAQGGVKVAHVVRDNITLIWLANSSEASKASQLLETDAAALGIETVLGGQVLQTFPWVGDPLSEPRAPDIVTLAYQSLDQHPDEQYIGLMFWNLGIVRPAGYKKTVSHSAVAPTILKLLYISRSSLQASRTERVRPLPGF